MYQLILFLVAICCAPKLGEAIPISPQNCENLVIKESFNMSESDLFGWDLLYKTIEKIIVREEDIIIALFHWYLSRHFNFRCIGVGDDKTLNNSDVGSELLPDGWNDSEKSYALRYVLDGNLYILLATKTEDTLIINFLDVKARDVSNLAVSAKDKVKCVKGPLKTIVPELPELLNRFKKELIDPVFTGSKREVTTQTHGETSSQHRGIPAPVWPNEPFGIPHSFSTTRSDPLRDIGRGDLDPLGRGGGGMLFPQPDAPFGGFGGEFGGGMGPFPPGSRAPPPGSRFDPIGPPDRNLRPNPNPTHFRPPPDFDDYYS